MPRPTRATVALLALGGAGGALWGASGYRLAHTSLAPDVRAALATALELPPDAVQVDRARLTWPARLVVDGIHAGHWTLGGATVEADPWAALGGQLAPRRATARAIASPLVTVEEAEATRNGASLRLVLRRVALPSLGPALGGLGGGAGEMGLELERGTLKRLAFSAARVGPVDGLAGIAVRGPDGWLVRAGRPGLSATGHLGPEGLAGQARLERYELGGLPLPHGLDLAAATADGTVQLALEPQAGTVRAQLDLRLGNLAFTHPRLARTRVDGVDLTVAGTVGRAGGAFEAESLHVGLGKAAFVLDGRWTPGGRLDLRAEMPRLLCADLLASLPRALVPRLSGLLLDGDLSAIATLRGDAHDWSTVRFGLDGTLGCRARADAPLGDVAALARPDALALTGHRVDGHPFPLGPKNPSWRALASLPLPVVRAFLVAEDGRFFAHHGFDLDRINRALAADLGAGRVERGASTITQQVAKNLWLVEERRTVARKIEEAVLAWRLEQVLGKRRILELYLNLVELGPGVYGIADAAERYFGKLPDELSADEAAQLAALLPAPRRGMDAAWQKRYRALAARLPNEKVPLFPGVGPRSSLAVRLSRR